MEYRFDQVKLEKGKTYYYTVEETGHWAYPDGTALTGSDNLDYDSFEMTETGAQPNRQVVPDGANRKNTEVVRDYVNPKMEPTTYHKVSAVPNSGDLHASITSPTSAYNVVDYFFTLQPDAGYEWQLTGAETMDTIAGEIKATLYAVNTAATDDTAFQGTVIASNIEVKWDAAKEQFYIKGNNISGDPIGANGNNLDPLRAGNLVITVPANRLGFASYTVTAIAGNGGQVKRDLPTGTPDGTTNATASGYTTGTLTETLSGGRTVSSIYTFKADAGGKIDKVVINGVEQTITDQQKANEFSYQFLNIAGDQSIHVSFVDANGNPMSDPYVTVSAGSHGSVGVAAEKGGTDVTATPTEVNGPGTANYAVDADKMTLTFTPATDYEIDTIIIDGAIIDKSAAAEVDSGDGNTYYTKALNHDLGLAKGESHSVAVTFKPKGEASTHAIVTATVAGGFGTLSPVGVSIYPVGSTPTYVMKPNDGWEMDNTAGAKSVMLDGADKSNAVTENTSTGNFEYTLPALAGGNVELKVTFSEVAYKVEGQVQIVARVTTGNNVAPATLTFVRAAVPGKTDKTEFTITSDTAAAAGTGADTKLLKFEGKIPVGTWTVTVQKQGYLNYTVSGFEVKDGATKTIYFGDSTCNGGLAAGSASNIKPIPLTPGDAAGEGVAIAFNDASMVVAGWLQNALTTNKTMGDIDESAIVSGAGSDTDDMSLVQNNMYKKRTSKDYTTFCGS